MQSPTLSSAVSRLPPIAPRASSERVLGRAHRPSRFQRQDGVHLEHLCSTRSANSRLPSPSVPSAIRSVSPSPAQATRHAGLSRCKSDDEDRAADSSQPAPPQTSRPALGAALRAAAPHHHSQGRENRCAAGLREEAQLGPRSRSRAVPSDTLQGCLLTSLAPQCLVASLASSPSLHRAGPAGTRRTLTWLNVRTGADTAHPGLAKTPAAMPLERSAAPTPEMQKSQAALASKDAAAATNVWRQEARALASFPKPGEPVRGGSRCARRMKPENLLCARNCDRHSPVRAQSCSRWVAAQCT
jgi:hypothetical protein